MRVGFEASAALAAERGGVGNYAAHLVAGLRRLAQREPDLELVFFSNRYDVQPDENLAGLACNDIYPRDRLPTRLLWLQTGLPRSMQRTGLDICHFPNHLGPVVLRPRCPLVVTMHDMSVYRCPEHHTRKTVLIHRAIMPSLARRGYWIVTDSEAARSDILEHLDVDPARVHVVYPGVDPQYSPVSSPADADVARRHSISFPYVVTVGTLEPRKNHARLVEAFGEAIRQERLPHHLVIVGSNGWKRDALLERVRTSPVADRIHVLGFVPSADLPALYRGADAFAFPSLYEGFGLPVVEALASGLPTLISRDPALTEVAGTASAVQVDALSPQDIARGLHRILTDGRLRDSLRQAGLRRSASFSWDRCASETLDLYREIAVGGQSVPSRVAV